MRWADGSALTCTARCATSSCSQAGPAPSRRSAPLNRDIARHVSSQRRLSRVRGEALARISTTMSLTTRRRMAAAALAIGSLTAVSASVSAAQAVPQTGTKVTMVKIVTRHPFGKMLATVKGRSLYIKPSGGCNAACLAAWPPLLLPKHTTTPLGTRCLGTAAFRHRRQVTYRGKRLYLFVGDSGGSVRGNGVSGFKVAKVKSGPCP